MAGGWRGLLCHVMVGKGEQRSEDDHQSRRQKGNMLKRKEAAKFFCGFETFHALVHAYLLLSSTAMTLFGVTTTPTLNMISILLNGAIASVLGVYAWKRPTPSLREATT